VEPEQLQADLEFLRTNGYRTLSGDEFLDHLNGAGAIPERSVMLTFDDGPRNFYAVAFPLLRRFSARAIAFIAPGLHAEPGADDLLADRPMNWRELEEIHATGLVQFQSHTLESRFVPEWPAPVPLAGCLPKLEQARRGRPLDLREDLVRSRELLEARLRGACVDHLSFPMYLGTPAAVDIARSLGFRACYWGLIPRRPLNRAGDSPFFVSRMSDEFLRRLPGERRVSIRQLIRERMHRVQLARAWRRKNLGSG
jgi:peptidoglycan/xylan/chitin deacetylase (PgdA/CDA1 family)